MKKIIIIFFLLLSVLACKKTKFSPEGPTDVRIRNIADLTFEEVIVSTSEKAEDVDTIGTIAKSSVSEYTRFKKAYPKAEISAKINIGGSLVKFSTGSVNYTYMQYIGRDRITYEVYISDLNNRELKISNVILDEALVLK
jgi:ABC-type transporter MlaC component